MCKNKKCNTSKCWLKKKKSKCPFFYISNNNKKKTWRNENYLNKKGKKRDGLEKFQFRKLNGKWRSGHVCWCWNGQNLTLEVLPNEGNVSSSSSSSSGCAWATSSPRFVSQPSNFFTSNRVFSFTHMWQWSNKVWVYVSCRSRKNSLPWDLNIAVFQAKSCSLSLSLISLPYLPSHILLTVEHQTEK